MAKFIESKSADMSRIAELLEICRSENHWANQGPLYRMLREAYSEYFSLSSGRSLVPCANGGIALEAMARLQSLQSGRKLRWVVSAFSFQNLGRGYFADVVYVDCDENGLLNMEELRTLPSESYDGIIVVNPIGHARDFDAYINFAKETGKALLLDNAAGISSQIPDWPWQSFSLHHTKPYGMGEGGMALVPSENAEPLYELLNYGHDIKDPAAWLNNGKLSDIACAFLIDRLERASGWVPQYLEQADRVNQLATSLGFRSVLPFENSVPAMSWAYVADKALPFDDIPRSGSFVCAKYYKPLAKKANTLRLFEHIINVPTHPDMAQVSDSEILEVLGALVS